MRTSPRTTTLVAAGLLLTGCTTAPPRLAVLDQPTSTRGPGDGVGPAHHIGDVNGATVYAARGPADQPWCVVIVLDTTEATSCTTDDTFARRGVTISVTNGTHAADATLLPDDFTGDLEDGWQMIGPNLAAPRKP